MTMPKLKIERKENPYRRVKQIAIRVNREEFEYLTRQASQLTNGKISDFVRYAATKYVVTKKDLVS